MPRRRPTPPDSAIILGIVRRVLTAKWWLLHVLVVVAVLVMLRLGLWQWHRAHSGGGGIQNYAYAFQWPVFAAFALFLWAKTIHEEIRRGPAGEDDEQEARQRMPEAAIGTQRGVRIGLTTEIVAADAADDPAVAAWNARLAALNAAHAAVEGRKR